MDKDTVNIIVPVYNVERYLRKCLNSIRKQTYKNIAVILVDDGSKDKSLQICEKYAKEDSRFKVFHQENGGAASARNVGLDYAVKHPGEHIMFVDADDWLPKNAVEALVRKQKETDADWVLGSYISVCPTRSNTTQLCADFFETTNKEKFLSFMSMTPLIEYTWAKLYKTQIFVHSKLHFDIEQKASEDALLNYQYIRWCKNISIIRKYTYYYNRLTENSLSHTYLPKRNLYKKLFLIERQKCFEQKGISNELFLENNDYVLVIFNRVITRYIRELPKKEAIRKLKETYTIFSELLKNISFEEIPIDNLAATKMYYIYRPMLKNGDYNQVYDFFCHNELVNNSYKEKVKDFIRKIMMNIRNIAIFGL